MPDPDHDAEPERRTDPRFDAWPIEQYDAYTRWPVERATPDEGEARRDDSLEWVGVFHSGETPSPYLYDPEERTLVEGRVDEERERVVVEDDHDRRELDEEESLGEHLEDIGEDHGWTWLSSFAREYLEDDESVDRSRWPTYQHSSFDRKNLLEDSAPDLAFVGSHTFEDDRERTYVLEREFDAFLESEGARITVREDVREATGEKRDRQAGDADLTTQVAFELAVDVDTDHPSWEEKLEDAIEDWHMDHRGPATADEDDAVGERSASALGSTPSE